MQNLVAEHEALRRAPEPSNGERATRGAFAWETMLPPEIAFLAGRGMSLGALLEAAIAAKTLGVSCDQVLLNEGLMRDDMFYRLLAEHLSAPFYAGEVAIDEGVDAVEAVWSGLAPLAPNRAALSHIVAPRGPAIRLLLHSAATGHMAQGLAITSPQRLGACVRAAAGRGLAKAAASALRDYDRTLSADRRLTARQSLGALIVAATLLFLCTLSSDLFAATKSIVLWTIFGSSVWLRLAATAASRPRQRERSIADRDLPIYSVVAALYDEANMVEQLVAALDAIDYPRAKLDVKIVLERGDGATLRAAAKLGLAARYDIVVAPPGAPRTKPRALNIALPFLRGGYVVVFDAEDKPEPDQLRRAVERFVAAPEIGCLQARLTIEGDQSWLETMFLVEYAALFGVINPGLAALAAPIALGGSSNHFRTDTLRRVGGWDAWNVAEDADLGLRLARFGVRVATLDSDTYEEAPASFGQWLAQRRRWHKGWLQTALVHSRHPLRIVRELGLFGAWSAFTLMVGAILGGMFGPLFALDALWRCAYGDLLAPVTPLQWAGSVMTLLILLGGLAAIAIPATIGLRRRKLDRLFWAVGLLPLYYCLISLAAWLAVLDLIWRPFHWSKTAHGARRAKLSTESAAAIFD